MTISSQGRKKSNFPAQSSILTGGFFDYFVNGTNYKISYTDLTTALGVTGSLTADGAASRTDILAGSGSAYLIRGLEDGDGITCSVSADNGASIAINCAQEGSFTALVDSFAVAQPTFASLKGGDGITISKASDIITIANTGTFPYGLVTMQGNTTATTVTVQGTDYLTGGTWVAGITNLFTASTGGRLTYTGADDYIATVDASLTIERDVGSGEINVSAVLAKNGTAIAASQRTVACSDTARSDVSLPWKLTLSQNDYIECFVANESGTDNILVTDAVFRAV